MSRKDVDAQLRAIHGPWTNGSSNITFKTYSEMKDVLDGLIQKQADGNVADDEAAEALSRVIEKADFAEMEILGQFNLGFIVVRRRKYGADDGGAPMDDLFIVDQHAADEKYNFETLQETTKIDSQKLFKYEKRILFSTPSVLTNHFSDLNIWNSVQQTK